MAFGKVKKFIIGASLALVVGISAAASGCTVKTKHPRALITVEFNQQEYAVEYTLYRNMYPNTVQHFIELAAGGFYDNTVVHDYSTGEWLTGGYDYNAEAYTDLTEREALSEYFEAYSKEDAYMQLFADGKLTPSVYGNIDRDGNVLEDEALPTLMGEFSNNIQQKIENGALTDEFGCLKMYYNAKETTEKVYVKPTADQTIMAMYKNNCATSLFSMQMGSSQYAASSYCVFAMVRSTDALDELKKAVEDYFADAGTPTASVQVNVDNLESFSKEDGDKGASVTFKAPKTPIIIKSVKITKY